MSGHTEIAKKDIRYPKRPKQYLSNDYAHRVSTVSMHVSFDRRVQEQEGATSRFLVYYDKDREATTRRFEPETRLNLENGRHFTPDVICSVTPLSGEPSVFVLEVYNGDRVKYIVQQLEKLFWILSTSKKIEEKLGLSVVPRILCTVQSRSIMERVVARIKQSDIFHVEGRERYLFFNLDTVVHEDFGKGWVDLEGREIIKFFP